MFQDYDQNQLMEIKKTLVELIDSDQYINTNHQYILPISKLIAEYFKLSMLFIDDEWRDIEKSQRNQCVVALIDKIEKLGQERNQIDNLDAILNEVKERGLVFIPTNLLKNLWKLGIAINQYRDSAEGMSDIEKLGIDVAEQAAKWVKNCKSELEEKKRELVPVRPF